MEISPLRSPTLRREHIRTRQQILATTVSQTRRRQRLPRSLVWGVGIVAVIALLAVFADAIAPYKMSRMIPGAQLQGPSLQFLFGTDLYGRDLFSRILVGSRLSLAVAVIAVAIGAAPGILAGLLSGMYPGWAARIVSQLMDASMALPSLLLAIALGASLGRSTTTLALALGIAGIPVYYRMARAETLTVNQMLFVGAARSLGARESHIFFRHILPNVLPRLLVLITLRIGGMLMAVSAFSFVGLGAQPPEPEWGTLLFEGIDYFQQAWWLMFFPGVAIAITVFGFNLLGDGLLDLLDKRLPAGWQN